MNRHILRQAAGNILIVGPSHKIERIEKTAGLKSAEKNFSDIVFIFSCFWSCHIFICTENSSAVLEGIIFAEDFRFQMNCLYLPTRVADNRAGQ